MSHLLLHILDTQSKDRPLPAEKQPPASEFVLQLFGTTDTGQSVRVDVEGFRPTLYIRLPSVKTAIAAVDVIRTYLESNKVPVPALTFRRVHKRSLYGFTAKTLFPFVEITCPSLATWRQVKNLFLNDHGSPKTRGPLGTPFPKGTSPDVYEANLDPMLRFFHVQGLSPCGWVQVDDGMDRIDDLEAATWTLTASYDDIRPGPQQSSAPFLLASWDIECYSHSGEFPVASKAPPELPDDKVLAEFDAGRLGVLKPGKTRAHLPRDYAKCIDMGDPVIQIGTTLTKSDTLEKHLFVWPDCDAIDGIVVHAYETEVAMIRAWFEWIVALNPDILIGYNVFGFDERYLWARAEVVGLVGPLSPVHGLSRTGEPVKCEEKRLSSSALGDNFMHIWSASGRLQIDLYNYIKRSASLPSYKLDEVAKHYLSGSLKGYGKGTAGEGNLVLTLGGAIKDLRVGRALCLLDETGESMTDKMVIRTVEGGKVTVAWPFGEDGEVLEEAELAFATKWVVVKDDISPADIFRLHRGSATDRALVGKYCLQDCDLVLELYKKLEVFNNSMSMANVCCVPIGYIFTRGQGIKAESLLFKACREANTLVPVLPSPSDGVEEDESYEGAIVLDPKPGFYSKSPIGVADFASLYPSTIDSENISHDSLVWSKDYGLDGGLIGTVFGSDLYDNRPDYGYTDITFDLLRPDPEDKRKHPVKVVAGTRVCRYAQPLDGSKALLPTIIRGLLAARKAKRKEAAATSDQGRKALLEAEQLAYKLTANSLYGQLGSGTFKVRLQDLAASVTAYGRKQILFAKEVIETFYGPEAGDDRCVATVVYGDTDSLFIEFDVSKMGLTDPKAIRQAVIDLTAEAGKFVTKVLKPPHDFEFDKVFDPMLMLSKKRYAGLMYEDNPDEFVFKYMGIALKRRDNAPIVKTIFGTAMRTLLLEKDVAKATRGVQQACLDLVQGKVKLGQLTITKSLRADYADASRIAHKVLADRMAAREPGSAPASGDRIPYVYFQPPIGSAASKLQGDRIESPAWIKAHGLTPDYEFYLHHQLQNPICQMFGLLLDQMPGSDTIPWSSRPEDPDKRLAWQEAQAAHLLFRAAYQACSKSQTTAFISKFFNSNETKLVIGSKGASIKPKATATIPTATTVPTKQTCLNQFMLDGFLVGTIDKTKAKIKATRAAAAKAAAATETTAATTEAETTVAATATAAIAAIAVTTVPTKKVKPKNEILNYK